MEDRPRNSDNGRQTTEHGLGISVVGRRPLGLPALQWLQGISIGLLFILFYGTIIPQLVSEWYEHSTFSYGFLVPVITGYLVWQRWPELRAIPVAGTLWAGIPLLMAVFLGLVGQGIGDTFSMRVSMILALASTLWLLLGREFLKALLFPVFYLGLMIPVPYVLIKDLTYYLRYSDATHAATALQLLGIPVYRESYFLHIPNMSLEVADVCSGVSSVFALFALGVIYAYFLPIRFHLKILLVACTFPFAITANLFRIIITAVLAYNFGSVVFQSLFHGFSGMATFLLALVMLILTGEVLRKRYFHPFHMEARQRVSAGADPSRDKGLKWGSFAAAALIFASAFYAAGQLDAGQVGRLRSDLSGLTNIGSYTARGSQLQDGYEDASAESSLSQVFVGQDDSPIELFVGYRGEQRTGNRLRSPQLYFPEHWNSVWVRPAEIGVNSEGAIHGNWMLARKGQARELVLYWYQIGSRTYGGEFEHRIEQIRRLFFERRSDGAIVRISTSLRNDEPIEAAQKRLQEFGIRLYPELLRVLPL